MKIAITFIQIIVSVVLLLAILLQSKGTGLGSAFGGGGEIYRTKRGVEKILYLSTIVLVVIFLLSSLASVLIR